MEAPANAEGSGAWDPDAAVVGTDTKGSTGATAGEVITRMPGMEAAGFRLAAGLNSLTAAFSAEEPSFLDLALTRAANAFPEKAAAFWGAGSTFSDGLDAFTGAEVALGASDMVGAEAGSTCSDA